MRQRTPPAAGRTEKISGLDWTQSSTGWRMFSLVIDQDYQRNSFQIECLALKIKADLIFYT